MSSLCATQVIFTYLNTNAKWHYSIWRCWVLFLFFFNSLLLYSFLYHKENFNKIWHWLSSVPTMEGIFLLDKHFIETLFELQRRKIDPPISWFDNSTYFLLCLRAWDVLSCPFPGDLSERNKASVVTWLQHPDRVCWFIKNATYCVPSRNTPFCKALLTCSIRI